MKHYVIKDEDRSVKEDPEELDLDCDVDVSNKVSIPALCSSDEESEDHSAILYLPMAPEVF